MIKACVESPVKVTVGVLLVALFGVVALLRMPLQLTPEVQIPTITIETLWPGASPQEVEREIVLEQEEQLKSVPGVTKMSSECMDSMGRISLEFSVGADMHETLVLVNSRLQQVREYPENAEEPVLSTNSSADSPIAWVILRPWVASQAEIREFQKQNPDLAQALEPALRTTSTGLKTRRLMRVAEEHPEWKERLRAIVSMDLEIDKFRRFAEDNIETAFERVPGVSNSNIFGGRDEELQVVLEPSELAARELTIADVRNALRMRNQDTSGGDFWEGKRRYVVRTLGQFKSPEEVASVILARRDGEPVYLRDVAEVRLDYKKPDGIVQNFGTTCLAVNCQRERGANVMQVMDGIRQTTRELNEGILKSRGLRLEQVYDETEYIQSSVDLVNSNIIVGGGLTFVVLLLFLKNLRSTLAIAVSIPICIIGTFLVLDLLGRSLNVISLAGMAFAVGMLVDNAVVVLEHIYSHHERGARPFQAAIEATKEVWGAVLASTLTTLAVFLPVLFVQEEAGQLFRDIALAISAGVGLSLIVSITVIPPAAARLLRVQPLATAASNDAAELRTNRLHTDQNGHGEILGHTDQNGHAEMHPYSEEIEEDDVLHFEDLSGRLKKRRTPKSVRAARARLSPWGLFTGFLAMIVRPLDWAAGAFVRTIVGFNRLTQQSRVLALAVVLLFVGGSAAISYLTMPNVEYLPAGNRNLVFGMLIPPPGYNLEQMVEIGEQIEGRLKPYWDLDDPQAAALDHPAIGDFFFVARGRMLFLGLRAARAEQAAGLVPLVGQATAGVPDTFGIAKQSSLFEQGLTAGRTVDVEIMGPELQVLVGVGGQVMGGVMGAVPGAQAIPQPSLDLSSPEVHVIPRWEQAADMGVSAADLGYTVDALVDGAYAADYYNGGNKIDLSILGNANYSQRSQDLSNLFLTTSKGDLISLSSVAEILVRSGPEQVNRRERQRSVTIQVSPPPGVPLDAAIADINSKVVGPLIAAGGLPPNYRINLAGTADKLKSTWEALRFNFLLAGIITYLLMAALFESWVYPLIIILIVPLGGVGGILGLHALNAYLQFTHAAFGDPYLYVPQSLDVLTMLGFIILIGTVVNNPILIVHQSLVHMREDGMSERVAVLTSVKSRMRPIFMTTVTTVLGLLPLVLFPGAGSELYRGLGSVLLGGLLVSTLVTLVLIPAVFVLMLDAKALVARLFGQKPALAIPGLTSPIEEDALVG